MDILLPTIHCFTITQIFVNISKYNGFKEPNVIDEALIIIIFLIVICKNTTSEVKESKGDLGNLIENILSIS